MVPISNDDNDGQDTIGIAATMWNNLAGVGLPTTFVSSASSPPALRSTAASTAAAASHRMLQETEQKPHHFASTAQKETFWVYNIIGSLLCVAMVAMISGLFLGLLTLDTLDLQIIQRASLDEDERMYATTLLPLLKKRHQILVTLLLMNALAYEALPIFLDALVPSYVAVLLSVTIVMFFGEVLPSGIFMGPNQLQLGYQMVPLMKLFLWIFHPIAMPMAKLLDYLTDSGDEHDHGAYNRSELSALIRIQHEAELNLRGTRLSRVMKKDRRRDDTWAALKAEILERVQETHPENTEMDDEARVADKFMLHLHKREVDMVEGALQMKTVHAMDVYTPWSGVYAVPDNVILDKMVITTIYGHGYSRVPVYHAATNDPSCDRSQVLGFLITRQLMLIDWDDKREVSTLPLQRPTCVSPRMNLIDLFEVLRNDGPMLTFVCARPDLANKALKACLPIPVEAGLMGIVTLVDVMESIIQDRIYDEGDKRERDRAVATLNRWAAMLVLKFMRRSANKIRLERRRSGTLDAPMDNSPNCQNTSASSFDGDRFLYTNSFDQDDDNGVVAKTVSWGGSPSKPLILPPTQSVESERTPLLEGNGTVSASSDRSRYSGA
jgi:metal transporter CNNM